MLPQQNLQQAQAATGRDLRAKPDLRQALNRRYMAVVNDVLRATPAYTKPGLLRKPQRLPGGVPFRFASWPALASQCVTVSFQIRDEDLAHVEALDDRMAMRAGATSTRVYRDLGLVRVEFTLPESQWLDVPLESLPQHKNRPCVGLRTLGSPAVIDWTIPHKTVFGGTQTGKTTFLSDLIISLARIYTPDECKFIILNPKNEPSLNSFERLPHLLGPIAVDYDDCATSLRFCLGEMLARRSDRARAEAARIVIFADEVADLVMALPEIGIIVTRLSQFAGGLRMNVVAASQAANPAVFGATGSLAKANFPAKIVFQLPREQSYLATGQAGVRTDTLGRKGDGLGIAGSRVTRFRAAWPGEGDFARLPRVETVPALDENLVVGDAALGLEENSDKYLPAAEVADMLAYAVEMRPDGQPTVGAKALQRKFHGAMSRASWIRDVAKQLRQRSEYWQEIKACQVNVLGEGEA